MTGTSQEKWKATEEQIDTMVIPAMKKISAQSAVTGEKLQFPPSFIALMLRDIADVFDEKPPKGESNCGYC